jgi:signal recognition particle GTPase
MGIEDLSLIDTDQEVKRIEGIIDSMTPAERNDPEVLHD